MKSTRVALVFLALAAALGGGFLLGRRTAPTTAASPAETYHCPMHPQVVSDKPGSCPICSMKLVRSAERRTILYYRNPMDPSVQSATPAKDAMGMEFVPVYSDEVDAGPSVAGRGAVVLSPERQKVLGLASQVVGEADLQRSIPTVGRVAVDERRVQRVFTKYEGYVERLFVDFTGQPVRLGQPLLELYSPELLATEREYLLARRARGQMAEGGVAGLAAQGDELVASALRRLQLLDVPDGEIERLEKGGEPRRTSTLYSRVQGLVTQKMVAPGSRVTPESPLFEVTDLDRVWVLADVYEQDLAAVRVGSPAEVRAAALPGRDWKGKVSFITPAVDPTTRTVKVRLEVDNPDLALKPEMFVDVSLEAGRGRGLVVPESAVLDSGERRLVFLDLGEGHYEPREVRLGPKTKDGYTVLSGLTAGDRVVIAGNFLLDSESSLKAALR
jgi:multidrug efflux pump subunit AcrA (membrane-fusion protein)